LPQAIPPAIEAKLIEALRSRNGRVTLADVVRDTGLPREQTEQHLRALLALYRSHLAVDDAGELLYLFDPALVRRVPLPGFGLWLDRAMRWMWKAFIVSFKVAVMVILVSYVVIFCVLIIAALLAVLFAAEDAPDVDFSGSDGCLSGLGDLLWFWDPGVVMYVPTEQRAEASTWNHLPTGLREPRALDPQYVTDTYRRQRSRKKRFHDSVFDFIFGPSDADPPATPDDLELLEWIVQHRGLITLSDLITRTGLLRAAAEQEMTRLLTRYDGDVTVSAEGNILYIFDGLRVTAGEKGRVVRAAPPTWHRFEPNADLTGNKGGRNALIATMTAFTLVMSVASPFIIFPILNIGGALAMLGLAFVPAVVSLLIFAIPMIRAIMISKENERRRAQNLRRAVLLVVYDHLANPHGPLYEDSLHDRVRRVLARLNQPVGAASGERRVMEGFVDIGQQELKRELTQVMVEFDADLASDDHGRTFLAFPSLERELQEADAARQRAGASLMPIGQVVYSSADEDEGLEQERLEAFDAAVGSEVVQDEVRAEVEVAQEEVGRRR